MSSSLPRLVLTGFAHRLLAVPAVWGAARLWVWPHVPFCFYAAVPWLSVLLGWHFCAAPTTAVGHWTSVSHGSYSLSCLWTGYILSLLLRVCVCVCLLRSRLWCWSYCLWNKLWATVSACTHYVTAARTFYVLQDCESKQIWKCKPQWDFSLFYVSLYVVKWNKFVIVR